MKSVAAVTCVRDASRFLDRWIDYYGRQLGFENLFIVIDGEDQALPDASSGVNLRVQQHITMSRLAGDKFRARLLSELAHDLLKDYDLVVGTDVDEFILPDPATSLGLRGYLSQLQIVGCVSAMGIDVARHLKNEKALDWGAPFLGQRRYGMISDRYTKASVLAQPHFWGSGFHRVRGQPLRIDPQLCLFHFGSVDQSEMQTRTASSERIKSGWGKHQDRRNQVSDIVSESPAAEGDEVFDQARAQLSHRRSILAWNKPRAPRPNIVVRIPDRFVGIV